MLLLNHPASVRCLFVLLNFNTSYVVIKPISAQSIQRRKCNFNTSYVVIKQGFWQRLMVCHNYFNTSYVVIKQWFKNFNWIRSDISIHHMLLLNWTDTATENKLNLNFNTSYVVIKPFEQFSAQISNGYFNTSYVVIKQT